MSISPLEIKDVKIFLQHYCAWDEHFIEPFLKKYKTSLPIETYLPLLQNFYHSYEQLKDTRVPTSSWNPFAPTISVNSCAEYIQQTIIKKWHEHEIVWRLRAPSIYSPPIENDIYLPPMPPTIEPLVWSFFYGDNYLLVLHDYLQKAVDKDSLFIVNYNFTDITSLSFSQKTQYFEHCFSIQAQNPQYLYNRIDKELLMQWITEWCNHHQTYLPQNYGREVLRMMWFNQIDISASDKIRMTQYFDPHVYYYLTQPHEFIHTTESWPLIFDDYLTTQKNIKLMKLFNLNHHVSTSILYFQLEKIFLYYTYRYAHESHFHSIEYFLQTLSDSDVNILGKLPATFGATTPKALSRYINIFLKEEDKVEFMAILHEKYPHFMRYRDIMPMDDVDASIAYLEQQTLMTVNSMNETNIHF